MKIKKLISNLITILLTSLLLMMVFMVVSSKITGGEPKIFGYELKTVLSGSMEPGFMTGSIIAVKPVNEEKKFSAGDIITFIDAEEKLVTHRILEVKGSGKSVQYITKGDNNEGADPEPVLSQNIKGEYHGFTLPYVGYALEFAKSKLGSALLLIVPGFIILAYSFVSMWRAIQEIERKNDEKVPTKVES
ncbi:signal peptidase I SipW [Guptibacillus hwajinpoensis]|uniref:signal peptidase I SipW n=1 Tax=Guptibacillus hwajinpoensis TaxID=208199 RepID=UPI001CFD3FD2|nr:signal peptidase I [Pseudalkalibacillus hwajinpoensis]WLR61535.1 signal peptidase I [Pseudalkalibacillus hwajinpoensis]